MTKEEAMLLEDAVQSARSAHKRIDDIAKEVNDLQKLTETVAVVATNVANMQQEVTEMRHDVKTLAAVPAKRWEAVIGYVMAALASGIVGAILGMVLR